MKVYINLQQHVGVMCKPVVYKGQHIKRGEVVAEPNGLGAIIHSSIAGTVVEITNDQIIVEGTMQHFDDYVKIPETEDKLEMIRLAGIVGSGGAGFPTHVKYSNKIPGGFVIANGVECEPLLEHNVLFMENHADIIVLGLLHLLDITGAEKAYIAIKEKHEKAVMALREVCKNQPNIDVKFVSNMYPAGDERVIVRELLGVTLAPGELPIVANAIISNVETIKRIVEAIEYRKPYIDKDFTVAGRVKESNVYLDQPIGTSVGDYLKESGGYIHPHGEIIIGGPFTGKSGSEQSVITKTTGGILVAMPFPQENGRRIGLLVCECGADEDRLKTIAHEMDAKVVAIENCKRMVEHNGRLRCDLPGICPGQAEKILSMKKAGMETILTSSCQA